MIWSELQEHSVNDIRHSDGVWCVWKIPIGLGTVEHFTIKNHSGRVIHFSIKLHSCS